MNFETPLQKGILIKRYKRFLADVETNKGILTMHCPNTGAMTSCKTPGNIIYYSKSPNKKRKYPHTFELYVNEDGEFVGINTHRANKIIEEALIKNQISGLESWQIYREVKVGPSRLDFLLVNPNNQEKHYIEVKSVTLEDSSIGYFPDAQSQRAIKHLKTLQSLIQQGHKASLIFCVQHTAIKQVRPATHIHPEYSVELQQAARSGVNIRAFKCDISPLSINISEEIQVNIDH